MRLVGVDFNEDDEPDTMVVETTAEELAMIYQFVGRVAPADIRRAAGQKAMDTFEALGTSVHAIGVRFYDAGWPNLGLNVSVGTREDKE